MVARPPFISQRDGTRCQWQNCGLAAVSMAIWRHREGLDPSYATDAPWPPKPSYLRNKLTPTTCPGTSLNPDQTHLASQYYNVQLEYRYDLPFADFTTLIRSGRGATVRILYAALHGTAFDYSPKFDGGHSIYVNEVRSDGYFYVADPVSPGFKWWPPDLLRDAAGLGSGEAGNVDCNLTRDTERLMIPITDETPKYVSASVGKQIYYTDGTKYKVLATAITNRLSPYGTTVAGVNYRIVRASSSGIKYVFMMKTADLSIKPVSLSIA